MNDGCNYFIQLFFQISHAGHVGGAVVGFLVSILVVQKFGSRPGWEKTARWSCLGILILGLVLTLWVNLAFPDNYLPAEWNFKYGRSALLDTLEGMKNAPKNSELWKDCMKDSNCKYVMESYIRNGKIPDFL